MRLLVFGTYDPAYSRSRTLLDGLRANGVEVIECHAPLWRSTEDKVAAVGGGWLSFSFFWRVLSAYTVLIRHHAQTPDYDAMLVLYGSLLDVFLGRLLSWLRRRPLIFDVFMSAWVISKERGLFQPGDRRDRLIRLVEGNALRVADALWTDTAQYAAVHQALYGIPTTKFRLIPTGSDARFFAPPEDYLTCMVRPSSPPLPAWERACPRPDRGGLRGEGKSPTFHVVYHGLFIPLHGTRWMVEAAARLRDHPDIHFAFIGDGHARAETEALAQTLGLTNVTFTGRAPREALRDHLAHADVVLGVFGGQLQGQITIPNKIYEGLAMGKPVITGRTPAAADAFRHGAHVFFVPIVDPVALADAILALRANPSLRAALAYGGHRLFQDRYNYTRLGALARQYLEEGLGIKD